jgi:hypothetical protein
MENKLNGWHTDNKGSRRHYRNGLLHREDGPALIYWDETQVWYRNGELHRKGGPAVIYKYGHQAWYRAGKLHREDGPAIFCENVSCLWYLNGGLADKETVLDTPEKREAYLLAESLRRL